MEGRRWKLTSHSSPPVASSSRRLWCVLREKRWARKCSSRFSVQASALERSLSHKQLRRQAFRSSAKVTTHWSGLLTCETIRSVLQTYGSVSKWQRWTKSSSSPYQPRSTASTTQIRATLPMKSWWKDWRSLCGTSGKCQSVTEVNQEKSCLPWRISEESKLNGDSKCRMTHR